MSLKSFEELECWKACKIVKDDITKIIKTFPDSEKYDLIDNMKRAARSTTRNIAEGFGRHHHKENAQFCRISRGSLYELIDDLITSKDENYFDDKVYEDLRIKIENALKILNGYIRYLSNINS
ncbi:MAG: four helix bundle protein [Cyclobacteriaceae bacterium]|nr:four helix bundle protein [Cyclobacteriaceae bacterium]MCK5471086.1 four helix bundle protein [Cyclobacteriaceae bacterium]